MTYSSANNIIIKIKEYVEALTSKHNRHKVDESKHTIESRRKQLYFNGSMQIQYILIVNRGDE